MAFKRRDEGGGGAPRGVDLRGTFNTGRVPQELEGYLDHMSGASKPGIPNWMALALAGAGGLGTLLGEGPGEEYGPHEQYGPPAPGEVNGPWQVATETEYVGSAGEPAATAKPKTYRKAGVSAGPVNPEIDARINERPPIEGGNVQDRINERPPHTSRPVPGNRSTPSVEERVEQRLRYRKR
jgi:hypothetical protein